MPSFLFIKLHSMQVKLALRLSLSHSFYPQSPPQLLPLSPSPTPLSSELVVVSNQSVFYCCFVLALRSIAVKLIVLSSRLHFHVVDLCKSKKISNLLRKNKSRNNNNNITFFSLTKRN